MEHYVLILSLYAVITIYDYYYIWSRQTSNFPLFPLVLLPRYLFSSNIFSFDTMKYYLFLHN